MKIGLIGTGLMGLPMAQRLLAANVPLIAYNRTSDKLKPLQQAGVTIAPSAADVLQHADATILMLSDASAIQTVLLNDQTRPHLANGTIIQMGTIAPSESRTIRDAIVDAGGEYLEAPVLGSTPQAQDGKLQVMVGSSPEQFDRWSSLLQNFGSDVRLIGEVGTAAALKLALNQLIASLTTAFSLSLALVQRQGVDVETFMDVLRGSALYAPTFDKKLQRMIERNFADPNFPVKHLLKDTNLFLQEVGATNLRVDALTGVGQILETAIELGLADDDYSALFNAVNPHES